MVCVIRGNRIDTAKDILVVSVSIDPSVESEWYKWYNDVHSLEIASCPGFRSAQRDFTGRDLRAG